MGAQPEMKVIDLFEAKRLVSQTIIGSMLLKLHKEKKPMKVLITGLKSMVKHPGGTKEWVPIPDQEWDVTSVRLIKTASGAEVRISNKSPEQWFELNPEDDGVLTIKKKDGYWLLTSRDGRGVRI